MGNDASPRPVSSDDASPRAASSCGEQTPSQRTALFVGGDARMIYAARYLAGRGINALFGANDSKKAHIALAEAGAADIAAVPLPDALGTLKDGDALVLPLPACRDGINASDSLFGEKIAVAGIFAALAPGTRVFCGAANAVVCDAARDARLSLADYYADEGFLAANAALTAEGAIAELIRLSPRSLLRSRAVVFGYGRCASQLARRLIALGSRVTVVARSAEKRALAEADGAKSAAPPDAPAACEAAVFAVNTVPAPVIGAREAAALAAHGAFVLELASKSGLSPEAAGLVRVVSAPGLPGRFSPASAGELIARFVAAEMS